MRKENVEQEITRNIIWSLDLISTLENTVRDSELLLARVRQLHDTQQLLCSSRYVSDMSKRLLQLSDDARCKPAESVEQPAQSDVER